MTSIPIIETVVAVVTRVLRWAGYPGLFGLMAVDSFGIPPLPGEIILVFAGFLVAMGALAFSGAVVVALLGGLFGAFCGYAVGRWGRDWLVDRAPSVLRVDPRQLARLDAWFARWGDEVVAVARVIPLARAYISYPAGTAEMPPLKFGFYTIVGALPLTLGLVYLGQVLGSRWSVIVPYFAYLDDAILVLLVVVAAWWFLRWHREYRRLRATPPVAPPS